MPVSIINIINIACGLAKQVNEKYFTALNFLKTNYTNTLNVEGYFDLYTAKLPKKFKKYAKINHDFRHVKIFAKYNGYIKCTI